ncbi:MAG: DUF6503 family protein [Bacteroidota bacterium]
MKKIVLLLVLVCVFSCQEKEKEVLSAQDIVDRSITVSGGNLYEEREISFRFRERTYISKHINGHKVLKRITKNDSAEVIDVKTNTGFTRSMNDSLVQLSDSMANKYANSVNSVHYFAKLPYGLNDQAVNKEYLGETEMNDTVYYKIKITFDQEGGGEDFEDTYVYWFNKETLKPDYLAYIFHVDGGGLRFRKAYNERYVNGIRFVDYENYRAKDTDASIISIDSLYMKGELELLSKIELKDILVNS